MAGFGLTGDAGTCGEDRMRVAYQGAVGAFGHQACLDFLAGFEPLARPTFAAVVDAVERGEAERGILPLENNEAGPTGAAGLIARSPTTILAEHELAVRMHLLALPGVALADVRTVVSHPIALRQCARTLASLGVATEDAPNTAVAARQLAERSRGVLASEAAAEAYGLSILLRDVHDRPDNATRFAVIGRRPG